MALKRPSRASTTPATRGDVEEIVGGLARIVSKSFEGVEKRFDATDKRLDRIDRRLGGVETRLYKLEQEVRSIREMLGTPDKPRMVTREAWKKLDVRLRKVEAALAAQAA